MSKANLCFHGTPYSYIQWDGTEECIAEVRAEVKRYIEWYKESFVAGRFADGRHNWILIEPIIYQEDGDWVFSGEMGKEKLTEDSVIVFAPLGTEYEDFGVIPSKEFAERYTKFVEGGQDAC